MTIIVRARHRAAKRPVAPLSSITQAATGQVSVMTRRTAVVAASSGLLVSMIGMAAPASAATADHQSAKLNAVDLNALTAQARAALESAPVVKVSPEAAFSIESAPVAVTPAPVPEPEPAPAPAPEPEPAPQVREQSTSRTQTRTQPETTNTPSRERQAAASQQQSQATRQQSTTQQQTTAQQSSRQSATQQQQTQQSQRAASETKAETPKKAEAAAPASAKGSSIISIAARYVGVPYVYGGTTPEGFDCSGFTSYVYRQAGISLPRTSSGQGAMGTRVSRAQAQPGDLIWTPGHVAIYAGDNMMIDAPRPGKTIQFRPIWQSNPTFIRLG